MKTKFDGYWIWLEMAKKDLNAAKHLLNRKLYPQAVFYLEQSVEKAVKSLGMCTGAITENEARSHIRHKTVKIYLKIFERTRNGLVTIENTLPIFPELKKLAFLDLSEIERLKHGMNEFQKEFSDEKTALKISSSKSNLRDLLGKLSAMREGLGNELRRIDLEFKELLTNDKKMEDLKRKLGEVLEVGSKINPAAVQGTTVERIANKLVSPESIMVLRGVSKLMMRLVFCYECLLYSCLILYPHVARTRYPEKDFNPIDAYDPRAPLIQALDDLIDSVEATLRELDLIYTEALKFGHPLSFPGAHRPSSNLQILHTYRSCIQQHSFGGI